MFLSALQVMGGEYAEGLACPYTSSGLLQATHPYGVVECDDGCAATPHCKVCMGLFWGGEVVWAANT